MLITFVSVPDTALAFSPKTTSVVSVSSPKAKQVKVKWKKKSKVTGYQIQYSTSYKFTKSTTSKLKVKGAKTTSKTIKKLKAGKKYYVRIRTYKTADGKTKYSKWSKYKKVTVKKPAVTSSSYSETEQNYTFRYDSYLDEHFEKHKSDTNTSSKEEYLSKANAVITDSSSLHKTEADDGDDIYYLEATNEIVFVSTDGYIRTYFCPSNGIDYYYAQ